MTFAEYQKRKAQKISLDTDDDTESIQKFRNSMLDRIKKINNDYPFVNLGEEENYFNNIISEE